MDNVETLYPLTPMQHGMLLRALRSAQPGEYVEQVGWTVRGAYDPDAFERAWASALERHPALRTAFFWKGMDEPVQVVRRDARVPVERHDWRHLAAAEADERVRGLAAQERRRGFDLGAAPLLRVSEVRLADGAVRILLSYHHLAMDGWSLAVCMGDVLAAYGALRRGESPVPEPAPPFGRYVAWVRGRDAAESEAFWRGELAGVAGPTLLGAESSQETEAGHGTASLELDAALARRLAALARRVPATLNTVFAGAWGLLLARLAGADEAVFGTVVSDRPAGLPGADGIVGLCIGEVPVRVRLDPAAPLAPWLRGLQAAQSRARRHAHLAPSRVQALGGLPAGERLYDTVLVFQNLPDAGPAAAAGPEMGDLRREPMAGAGGHAAVLEVVPGATVTLNLTHDAARLDGRAAARLLERLRTLLEAVAEGDGAALGALSPLSADERRLVLHGWNDTARDFPRGLCVHRLVEAQAARTPDRVAVEGGSGALTYTELDARADGLAARLRAHGVGPESRVAVLLDRSPEMVVALLAVLKSGGAYVPLDPAHPAERLALILRDSAARVLLAEERHAALLPAEGVAVLTPHPPAPSPTSTPLPPAPSPARGEGENDTTRPEGQEALPQNWGRVASLSEPGGGHPADPDNLAYVIYTSGSTGTPKGVAVPHRALANFLHSMRAEPGVAADDVLLAVTTPGFDIAALELFLPLTVGARVVVADRETASDPGRLAERVATSGATMLQATPATWRMLLDAGWTGGPGLRALCGGEALDADLAGRLRPLVGEMWNLYGPTETTVWSTAQRVESVEGVPAIGRPIANTRAYVLDRWLDPLPAGAEGELFIAGAGVARGYAGRPELTAERFVPEPFAGVPGARMYRTGDRASRRPDGALDFRGRADFQVKVRGHRVEPGEVEAVLLRHPGVRQAVVAARPDAAGTTRLVAYVVGDASAADLRDHVRGALPEYMVPAAFVGLDALPLTPAGKIDRRALPAPELAAGGAAAPRTELEEVVAGIWAEVLGTGRVGVHDDFFALGGHSLLATQVVARVRRALGVDLPFRDLFRAPTVAAIAARVEALRREGGVPEAPPIRAGAGEGEFPLSFAQSRLWFIHQLDPASAVYNIPAALAVHGEVDAAVLERLLAEIVRRHAALRTVFRVAAGEPVQVVLPDAGARLQVVDLSGRPAGAREEEARRILRDEAARPFDLERGPLFRAALLRVEPGRSILLFTLHHVVGDEWSVRVLVREASALYAAFSRGEPSPLPELPVQYADYALWQREWLRGEALDRRLDFWRERLAGAPAALDLPTDHARPAAPSDRAGLVRFALPPEPSAALRALSRREGATPFMALLAAFAVLLSRWSGLDDVVVGTPVAGRGRVELEELVGFFANTLALRTRLSGEPTVRGLLARVREGVLDAQAHADLPFERLVDALGVERRTDRTPLFQVMLTLERAVWESAPRLGDLPVEPLETGTGAAPFDLALLMRDAGERFTGTAEYRAELWERGTVERMTGHLAVLLEGMAARPDARVADLPMLTAAERAEVLDLQADAPAPIEPDLLLHQLVEAQAARTPDAPAVVFAGGALTYAELDARAGALAAALRARGAGPETRVAICTRRSPEMAIAILAVLKSGAAYVPLDPSHPDERLARLLSDCGARLLLTQTALADRFGGFGGFGGEVVVLGTSLPPAPSPARGEGENDETADASAVAVAGCSLFPVPCSLAYVIYTSGSTGTPKGVAVEHRSVVAFTADTARRLDVRPSDRVLQLAAPGFDVVVEELFPAWSRGAAVVLASDGMLSPGELLETVERHGVTWFDLPTAYWHEWVRHLARTGARIPASVRFVVVGGERIARERLADWTATGVPLVHMYGVTEATVNSTAFRLEPGEDGSLRETLPIGRATGGARLYVLDGAMQPLPAGVPGELWIGGAGVARGYLGRPDLTADRFLPDPFSAAPGARLYRTGDRVRRLASGDLEFLGRVDQQVKVRGFRVEPGEVEAALLAHSGVRECVVVAREDAPGEPRLVAYFVGAAAADGLRGHLRARLPAHMVPAAFVSLAALPLSANGKVDRAALPAPEAPARAAGRTPRTATERLVAEVWADVLGVERVSADDNFFDLGGHSLLLVRVHARLAERLGAEAPIAELFQHPTLASLAAYLDSRGAPAAPAVRRSARPTPRPAGREEAGDYGMAIAVVGMSGRFPGARGLDEFWRNLRGGVDAVTTFTDEELLAAGVPPAALRDPRYVRARGVLADVEMFEPGFFGLSPREATILDPQQRLFLECAWEALESAGYDPEAYAGRIGVFSGADLNRYQLDVRAHRRLREAAGGLQIVLGNGSHFLPLRASHRLNLTGPSLNVQTACSSSLVAVHLACQSLVTGDSDMVLAGGVSIFLPQTSGYLYREGGVFSPDGRCRAFDARAGGTVSGNGAGVVVLRRLKDALADGDAVLAVIRGSAVTNDGRYKAGFPAPGREGQARAIGDALARAGISPDTVGYVEAHGSGTEVGDPVEIAALTQAFREGTDRTGFCAVGSVKTSIGHLDTAAGIAGLIKAVLALRHGEIPPSLHFSEPNPRIGFAGSPFVVADALRPWNREGHPRRAGVSSFGLGGTNAHVVLEEAPARASVPSARPWQLVVLSARTPTALEAATDRLAAHLRAHPEQDLADVAFTLQAGRRAWEHRRVLVCRGGEDAAAALEGRDPRRLLTSDSPDASRPVAFLFPGLGDQYAGMAAGLYATEPVFRETVDRCAEILRPRLGTDLRDVLYPGGAADSPDGAGATDLRRMLGRQGDSADADSALARTALAHPAVFVTGYALARLWMARGVVPDALAGHSLGEYVAATVAGVFSEEDALALVAERARLVEELPEGAMLAVPLGAADVEPLLRDGLALAASNAPGLSTVSGLTEAVAALEAELAGRGIAARRLPASHAFHSPAMQPVAERLAGLVASMQLQPPRIPFVSNVTGHWITAEEAADPAYWAEHLCRPVRFAEGMRELLAAPGRVLLEVGPGRTLGAFALHAGAAEEAVLASLRHAYTRRSDAAFLAETLGRLWLAGVHVDWAAATADEPRLRVPLPTYPFERERCWVEPRRKRRQAPRRRGRSAGADVADALEPADTVEAALPAGQVLEPRADDDFLHARPRLANAYVAPATDTERAVAAVWSDLLGVRDVGVHDDFFGLGGHSLLATQILTRLRADVGAELSLGEIFEAPTVAALAAKIDEARVAGRAGALPPLLPVPRDRPLPLSPAQERLWALQQIDPESPFYTVSESRHLAGPLDVRVLERTLKEVLRRHEALRSAYVAVDGDPVQLPRPVPEVFLPVEDLRGIPRGEREAFARCRAEQESRRPVDPSRGPVYRPRLLVLDRDEHVLLTSVHHIAYDGWSAGVFWREVRVVYDAFARGRASPLPEPELHYADFAVWHRAWMASDAPAADLAYWREHLRGAPHVVDLPTDRPRPPVESHRGALHVFTLDAELAARLRAAAAREGTTLYILLLAAYEVLLLRHSGQEDMVVGSLSANRAHPETHGLVGCFLNTVALRADLSGDPAFRELLVQARGAALGADAHQYLPFDVLLDDLRVEREPGRHPLVQTMFVLQQRARHGSVPDMAGLEITHFTVDSGVAKFDVGILADEHDGIVEMLLEYRTDLFDHATMHRWAGHCLNLLEHVAGDTTGRLSELPFLGAAETDQLLHAWNDTAAPFPADVCIHDLFAAQAACTPHAPALRFAGRTTTYAQLDGASARLADRLRALGAAPETRVGIFLERSPEMVAAVLGVLRSGAAYVPLDPAYPAERLAFLLADSGITLLVTDPALAGRLPEFAGTTVLMTGGTESEVRSTLHTAEPADGSALSHSRTPALSHSQSLAYVIYTSGSTGTPKGVLVPHRGVVNLLLAAREHFGAGPGLRMLQAASLSFDAAVVEIFAPLTSGGTVVLAPRETLLDSQELWLLMIRERISALAATPALLAALPEHSYPELRAVTSGGDRTTAEIVARWAPGRRLLNAYAPTEATVYATVFDCAAAGEGPPPIGRPIANLRAYVLDARMAPVPLGGAGEVYLGGAGVVRGYHGRAELTAERFVPDPFSGDVGARLYRTGDRARRRADGELEFLGRVDAQVKVRGFRIEPGEVEAALRAPPGVRDA
ncbi:MAG: amino acid adenylation domain-containing protein, partial [Gemmatimonadota bacterium]